MQSQCWRLGTVSRLSRGAAEPVPCPPACLVHKWTTGRRTGAASEQVCAQRQRASRLALSCRGSSAHVATSSSGSTATGGVLLGHEAPKQLSRSLCTAGRHRMRVRLRSRASSLRYLAWKTRRRLALRRRLEFGDVEGASASGSSGWAVRAGRADCGAGGGTAAGERRVGAACAERFPASRANTMVMPPTRSSSAPARFARRSAAAAPAWQPLQKSKPSIGSHSRRSKNYLWITTEISEYLIINQDISY